MADRISELLVPGRPIRALASDGRAPKKSPTATRVACCTQHDRFCQQSVFFLSCFPGHRSSSLHARANSSMCYDLKPIHGNMSHLLQSIEFPPPDHPYARHPPTIVATKPADPHMPMVAARTRDSSTVHGELKVLRTSPCWTCSCHGLSQVTSRHQLGHRVRLGFSRHPCTVSAISPSYDVQLRCSWMHWKANDEMLLVLAPKDTWIILCDHEKVLHHLFWAFSGFVSCWALSPCCGRPLGRPQP